MTIADDEINNPISKLWLAERKKESALGIKRASDEAEEMLRHAIANVNEQLGAGAAERHPAIVAAMIQASALSLIKMPDLSDLNIGYIGDIAEAISKAGSHICGALLEASGSGDAIREAGHAVAGAIVDANGGRRR